MRFTMLREFGILAAMLSVPAAGMTAAVAAEQPRAVVELFTSQGCSSCPPADRVLGDLVRDPSIVALSLNVDYWDYIGWKDTLALHGHSVRQQIYSRERGDRQVYTPQAVVNGMTHALGSDKSAIRQAIEQTRQTAKSMKVPVSVSVAGGNINVSMPAVARASGEIWLCPVTSKISVAVGRGENYGRDLTYYNVVRGWTKLGDYTGKAETFSVPVGKVSGENIDAVAVMVQDGNVSAPGPMLGAALTSIQ